MGALSLQRMGILASSGGGGGGSELGNIDTYVANGLVSADAGMSGFSQTSSANFHLNIDENISSPDTANFIKAVTDEVKYRCETGIIGGGSPTITSDTSTKQLTFFAHAEVEDSDAEWRFSLFLDDALIDFVSLEFGDDDGNPHTLSGILSVTGEWTVDQLASMKFEIESLTSSGSPSNDRWVYTLNGLIEVIAEP